MSLPTIKPANPAIRWTALLVETFYLKNGREVVRKTYLSEGAKAPQYDKVFREEIKRGLRDNQVGLRGEALHDFLQGFPEETDTKTMQLVLVPAYK